MFLRYFILLIFTGLSIQMTAQVELPEDFYEIVVNDGWDFPAGLTFDDTGRIFVWEKAGLVYVVDTAGIRFPEPLLDISEEVSNYKDLGMLGFALDPDFLDNGHFYTMYVVDGHHLRYYGTTEYHPDSSINTSATIGRLTRFTADTNNNFETLIPDSRKVLIGESATTGIPIMHEVHATGALLFATDGMLLASMGDGTTREGNFATQGVQEGILKPKENIGPYRSQLIDSHSGKILRVNPKTGDGVPSNPFYDADAPRSPRSRVWALGFRNPYRMTLRPETGSHFEADGQPGTLYVSDVGAGGWEEINVVTEAGQNFGWPLYEGLYDNWGQAQYRTQNQDAPNPLFDNNTCPQEFFDFQHLLIHESLNDAVFPNPCDNNQMIPDNDYLFMHRRAAISYNNNNWNGPTRTITPGFDDEGNASEISVLDNANPIESDTFTGVASIMGTFYTGSSFPEEYQNALYSTDYSGWIRRFYFDDNQELTHVAPFAQGLDKIIHLEMNPHDGCLYYFTWETKLFKICYGGNPPPIAVAKADVYYGASPLTVHFDASASFDPNELPVSYSWDFGNGDTNDSPNPIREFTAPDDSPYSFTVTLTVTDSLGASSSDDIIISLNNTPPQVKITSFDNGDTYPLSGYTLMSLIAEVSDNEHAESELTYEWQTFLHHGDHFHTDPIDNAPKTSTRISPLGCGDEIYYHEIRLKVTDPAGLSAEDNGFLYPNCNPPFFELEDLNARPDDQKIMLDWATLTENGAAYFDIYRSEGDFNFIQIGTKDAIGNPATKTIYEFEAAQPLNGTNAYRLKIYDSDGNYEYSKIVSAEFPVPAPLPNFLLYPNPTNDLIYLNYTDINELATFALYNHLGQKIYKSTWRTSGPANYTISIKDYQPGVYIYVLDDGNTSQAGKLVVEP